MSRIEDAGEKIGGAKKDRWKERAMVVADLKDLNAAEQFEFVTKDNVWPRPNYESMIERGMEPKAAALMKIARDRMAAKPVTDSEAGRAAYVTMMGMVRDRLMACETQQQVLDAYSKIIYDDLEHDGRYLSASSKQLLLSIRKGNSDAFRFTGKDTIKAGKMVSEGWPSAQNKVPAWRKQFVVLPSETRGWSALRLKDRRFVVTDMESEQAVEDWLKAEYGTKRKQGVMPHRPHLDDLQRLGPDRRSGRDVGSEDFIEVFGFRGVEFGNWVASDERQKSINAAFDALMDLAEVLDIPPGGLSLGGTLAVAFGARGGGRAAAHYEPGRRVINLTKISGAGALAHEWGHAFDHYCGYTNTDIDRGKPIGGSGWYDRSDAPGDALTGLLSEERNAWNRLMETIHYRPITRDEAIARQEKQVDSLASDIARYQEMRDKLQGTTDRNTKTFIKKVNRWLDQTLPILERRQAKLEEMQNADPDAAFGRQNSHYLDESIKISSATGYWQRPTEMFARAFEAYVDDTLKKRDQCCDYLVHSVSETAFADPQYKGNPYPRGEERALINTWMAELLDVFAPRLREDAELADTPAPGNR